MTGASRGTHRIHCQVPTPGLSDTSVPACPLEQGWAQRHLLPLTFSHPPCPGPSPSIPSFNMDGEALPRLGPVVLTWLS